MAIGFASREIFQNFLAGILLLLSEPFRLGDQIKIEELEDTVEAIETRATIIRHTTHAGLSFPIPNCSPGAVIVNTAYGSRRMEYVVSVDFGDDAERAKGLILEAVRGVQGMLADSTATGTHYRLSGF